MTLLTLRDVMASLKVSESTVRRWVREGLLPAYRVGKRGQFRIKPQDLETFLESQRVNAGQPATGDGDR